LPATDELRATAPQEERRAADPTFQLPAVATMAGPDKVPAFAFEDALRERLLA
jgi:hypothetical protein